jgi:phenylpropionate dioxygenase-like ring-hydroxylating dioxygenase large terminal subunit
MEPSGITIDPPVRVPVERYLSPDFAALEDERLWPRTWVLACSIDHVSEPGDFYELRLGWNSVMIVRGDDGVLRAFQNVCRHRGNALCQGAGSGLTEIRCGYHRWAWDLSGQLREIPSRRGFGAIDNDELPLFRVQVDTWGPMVFVNLDPEAEPLADYLEGVPADVAWVGPDELRCQYMITTPVACNWKVISDGFSETYHIQGLHREMLGTTDDINSPQHFWDRHGVSYQPYGVPSPRLGRDVDDQVVWDAFVLTQGYRMGADFAPGGAKAEVAPVVPDGSTMQDVIAELIRQNYAGQGIDLGRFDTDRVLRLCQYNLFPNTTVLVSADLFTVITSRPGPDAGHAELVMLHFGWSADPSSPRAKPMDVMLPKEQANLGFVLDADLRILERVQLGLHQRGMQEVVLSSEECRIINMQRHLEQALGLEPGQRVGG